METSGDAVRAGTLTAGLPWGSRGEGVETPCMCWYAETYEALEEEEDESVEQEEGGRAAAESCPSALRAKSRRASLEVSADSVSEESSPSVSMPEEEDVVMATGAVGPAGAACVRRACERWVECAHEQ